MPLLEFVGEPTFRTDTVLLEAFPDLGNASLPVLETALFGISVTHKGGGGVLARMSKESRQYFELSQNETAVSESFLSYDSTPEHSLDRPFARLVNWTRRVVQRRFVLGDSARFSYVEVLDINNVHADGRGVEACRQAQGRLQLSHFLVDRGDVAFIDPGWSAQFELGNDQLANI